jgi:hypothetical protein
VTRLFPLSGISYIVVVIRRLLFYVVHPVDHTLVLVAE